MNIRLDGQVAIVTGGDSGLGRACAINLAEGGAKLTINFHKNKEKADEVVEMITKSGGECIAAQGDMGKEDDVAALFKTTLDSFGSVDIVVANAGIQMDAPIGKMTLEQWNGVITTNLTSQFLCCRAAIGQFRKQGDRKHSRAIGKILCMSSVHDIIPWAGHTNYAASKGGISMLMKTLAQEVAPEKIRINAIAPGAIHTSINEGATEGEAAQELMKLIPYKRIGNPDDVGKLALFLVSDQADYMVGSTVYIDGGMMLYPGFEDNG